MKPFALFALLFASCSSAPKEHPPVTKELEITRIQTKKSDSGETLLVAADGYDRRAVRKPLSAGSMAEEYFRTVRVPGLNEEWTVRLGVDVEVSTGNTCLNLTIKGPQDRPVFDHDVLKLNRFFYQWPTAEQPDEHVYLAGLDTKSPELIVRDLRGKTEKRCTWNSQTQKFQ